MYCVVLPDPPIFVHGTSSNTICRPTIHFIRFRKKISRTNTIQIRKFIDVFFFFILVRLKNYTVLNHDSITKSTYDFRSFLPPRHSTINTFVDYRDRRLLWSGISRFFVLGQ